MRIRTRRKQTAPARHAVPGQQHPSGPPPARKLPTGLMLLASLLPWLYPMHIRSISICIAGTLACCQLLLPCSCRYAGVPDNHTVPPVYCHAAPLISLHCRYAGVLSAVGIHLADIVTEVQEPAAASLAPQELPGLAARLEALAGSAAAKLRAQGFRDSAISTEKYLNLRCGQQHSGVSPAISRPVTSLSVHQQVEVPQPQVRAAALQSCSLAVSWPVLDLV